MENYKNFFSQDSEDIDEQMVPIFTEIEINNDDESIKIPTENVPILTLRNMIMFPTIALPVTVGRTKSLKLIKEAKNKKKLIGVICQIDESVEDPDQKDLFPVGVVAEILRVIEMPDKTTTVILQGKRRFELEAITQTDPYHKGTIRLLDEISPVDDDREFEALTSTVREMTLKYMRVQTDIPREAMMLVKNMVHPKFLIHFICSNLPISLVEKQSLLEINELKERAYHLIRIISRETQLEEIKSNIQTKAREDLSQQQKEYFLQQQIKTIQEELGSSSENEIREFRQKAAKKKWSAQVAEVFEKEVKKLERIHPQAPDFSMQLNYLQTFIGLPWGEYTTDHFNLKKAQKVLDKDHFGMDKVKERILEHLAVLQLKGDMKSPIVCLYGPPGVGKTSLGKSIAESLKRKYIRVSLGGLHDEAEIRGHRRTYIGAMPGRIIQGIQKAASSNPVFVLDEIDKLGRDFKGDPSAALLEVLDPEQNNAFHDNFLDVDYDLSKVLFIATANNVNDIPRPLLDRMELIEISGYIMEEKVEIARKHLVPKEIANHGLKKEQIKISKPAIEAIVEGYSRESGVRELDKKIAKIMRKTACKLLNDEIKEANITPDNLSDYLGMVEYTREKYQTNDYAGVVTGLAWTAVGGEILFVESSLSRGKASKLTLTGNLGEVMKESAILALEYIRAHASLFGINETAFDNWNVHVHVPEGAIPKDGPSAGVTMTTSLVSSFTQRKVKKNLAMTGEITLRGRVLPVGGIKEKILAAKRAGIKEIILSKDNEKDIKEINQIYLDGLQFHFVRDISEVIQLALLDEKVSNPLEIV